MSLYEEVCKIIKNNSTISLISDNDITSITDEIKNQINNNENISQQCETLLDLINKFLNNSQNIMKNYNTIQELINSQITSNDEFKQPEYINYIIAKVMTQEENAQQLIENTLKDGYRLIDKIREIVTGETITYQIGVQVSRGKKKTLYEKLMTIDEILTYSHLSSIWKSSSNSIFKLRLHINKRNTNFNNNEWNSRNSDKWRNIISTPKYNKLNQGNVYEAFVVQRKKQHKNLLLKATRANTKSFIKGGDFGLNSIKFFGKSDPSLATLQALQSALNIVKNALNLIKDKSLSEYGEIILKILFGAKKFDTKTIVQQYLKRDIDDALKDLIKTAFNL